MRTVGFVHTARVHESGFRELVRAADASVEVVATVDEALLETARRLGPDDTAVVAGIERAIASLAAQGATSIVCTCSTIGASAEQVGGRLGIDVVRVDRAMAERAAAIGGRVVVLAALECTLGPTTQLIAAVADARDVEIETHLVEGAWECFEAGDHDGFHALVADAIVRVSGSADVVVLAQASMAGSADRVAVAVPVLTSPLPAVERLLAQG